MLYDLLDRAMKEKYDLTTLVETGTGRRHGIVYALGLGFEHIYSMETDKALAKQAAGAFTRWPNVHTEQAKSVDALPSILPKLTGNVCWWLDGHSVGNDRRGKQDCWPLMEELDIIRARDLSKDVLILDDQHRYKNPDYSWLESTHTFRTVIQAFIAEPK